MSESASGYREYQIQATATGTSSSLAVNFLNDPSYFHLANVDAAATPVPVAACLLGSGRAGLVGIRRRYNR
ncbi:hypothetical protein [Geomesophilobacter sediminis]|uniref:PEP-CTERM protein-sorting domain-containing protein n=1 Tax=Geomesophilobacter sediminis TaxID=2798584 RepID=A0A8J7JB17_9BACT|nr:hypothetical protein [Geomesophilobacter sediminis]MBJ6724236.1 hypothetical protein [Geomesophilobacter sediminis]